MSRKTRYIILGLSVFTLLFCEACKGSRIDDSEMNEYIQSINKERAEKDLSFQSDPNSPFNRDTSISFKPLVYYEPDPEFVFKSKLFLYETQDTVKILGTKGETRYVILLGYVQLKKDEEVYRVNIYRAFSRTGEMYHSIWFTDRTTGKETYGVGRYLDIELNPDPNFIYTIDFNDAYNPYCSYSSMFTCPIPREEDHIDMEIEAGEKNFH